MNKDLRWVSCSKEASWSVAEARHLVRRGGITTVCGATASTPDVWRGNTTKPECRICKAQEEKP